MPEPRAIQFGAGAIGRGFIGALLLNSGYHVTFADVNEPLLAAINTYGEYTIRVLFPNGTEDDHVSESSISGYNTSSEAILLEIVNADIITTAVGPDILKFVAPALARGLIARRKKRAEATTPGSDYLNIIACENRVGASTMLRDMVAEHLRADEDKAYFDAYIGFANCSVDRIVPPLPAATYPHNDSDTGRSTLDVGVEQFYEWVVDETALKGDPPFPKHIHGMQLTDRLPAYHERKLFTLNTGHAMTAYLGHLKGYHTIDQAILDDEIARNVSNAMHESGAALCRKFGFVPAAHEAYIERILARFKNPHLRDECLRVGREPLRKLGRNDRFVGPARLAKGFGLPNKHLCRGIAAVLRYDVAEDEQSRELMGRIEREGVEKVAMELTGWEEEDVEIGYVVWNYEDLKDMNANST